MLTKRLSMVALLALLLPILAACGSGDNGAGSGADTTGSSPAASAAAASPAGSTAAAGGTAAPGKLAIEPNAVLRFQAAANETEQKIYQEGAARFEAAYPGAKLTFEPSAGDFNTVMQAAFSGNTEPDVFYLNSALMGQFAPNGLLMDLGPAMQEAGVSAGDFLDPLVQLYQYEGKQYALPKDFNPLVLFINNQIAQEAGVDPQSIKTWEDLTAAAQKMTKGEGPAKQYGMCLNPDILRYGASMFQLGNPMVENNQAVFNNEQGVQAIQYWYDFKKNGTGELAKNLGKDWCGAAFAGKNTAMAVEGGWLLPFMSNPANGATDVQYTAIPLPTPQGGQPATWLFTNGFAASARSKFPKAAAAAVLYLVGEENQREVLKTGVALPSLKSLANDPYYNDKPNEKVLVEQGPTGRLADTVLGGPLKFGQVLDALNKSAMEPIFIDGADVKESLDAAADQANSVLATQ